MLAHGFPLDNGMWDAQLSGLADRCFVIAPDLRGHGRSDVPTGSYSMEQHADDLAALLDALRIEKAIVAGLSMGGYVALAFWKRHAAPGERLGADRHPRQRGYARRQVDARMRRSTGSGSTGSAILADEMLPRLLAPEHLGDTQVAKSCETSSSDSPWKEWSSRSPPCATGRTPPDVLPTITAPALVIVGRSGRDHAALRWPRRWQAAIPMSSWSWLPARATWRRWRRPQEVNQALLDLVRRAG